MMGKVLQLKGPICKIKRVLLAEFEYSIQKYVVNSVYSPENTNHCIFLAWAFHIYIGSGYLYMETTMLHHHVSTVVWNKQIKHSL